MNIPLINSNSKQDINTSLIAIRNAINELSRMKESESVEDLQRQINIINQQIANFNSEFSAINTHLNTIDTNILNLQPVDTVASGNLHSVTSNAVANMNSLSMQWFWNDDPNVNMDVLEKAETMPVGKVSNFRVGGIYVKNSPYGTDNANCDFIYTCYRIGDSNFTRLLGIDVRTNNIYEKAKIVNVWSDWYLIQQNSVINESADSWFVSNNYLELGYAWHTAEGRVHTLDFNGTLKQGVYQIPNERIFNIPANYKSVTPLVEFNVFFTDSITQAGRGFMDNNGVGVWSSYNANTIQGYYFGHLTWIA